MSQQSLGPADYITLASTYHTAAITDIPVLKLSDKNQARRFISLIDALYEARCRIVCLAETKPEGLFFPDAPSAMSGTDSGSLHSHDVDVMLAEAVAETRDVYRPNVSSYDTPNMAEAPEAPMSALALDTLSIFSGVLHCVDSHAEGYIPRLHRKGRAVRLQACPLSLARDDERELCARGNLDTASRRLAQVGAFHNGNGVGLRRNQLWSCCDALGIPSRHHGL